MKTTPITFNTEMAQAIREGRKTQTRRVVKDGTTECPYGSSGDVLVCEDIRLLIREVRKQRLQDIHAGDALAEGLTAKDWLRGTALHGPDWAVHKFRDIWEYIYGPGSWDKNPEVWAITFETLQEDK